MAGLMNDKVGGGEKRDIILGGFVDDDLYGGQRRDIIIGDPWNVAPTVVVDPAVDDFSQELTDARQKVDITLDQANPTDLVNLTGKDAIFGGDGHDILLGMFDSDRIIDGGERRDYMSGRSGDDIMEGRGGSDVMWSGAGDDTIGGGLGGAFIWAGAGNDVANGDPIFYPILDKAPTSQPWTGFKI